ncbi:MAG: ATP-binding protein [Candidatus Woesearchaeota archaeon]
MYDIIIGRTSEDREKYGSRGTIFLGRHFIKMGQTTSLSNNILLDVVRSHVVFICGKRGGGKSYTMGVVAEGVCDLPEEVKQNISVIMLDTMGVYWTMKYANQKEENLLREWGLEPKALDIRIFTPVGFHQQFIEQGIPSDYPFSLLPSELDANDWCMTFGVSLLDPLGVLIERAVDKLKKSGKKYSVQDIIDAVRSDDKADKQSRDAVENRFTNALNWGIFSEHGTELKELAQPGKVTVLDVSCYSAMPDSWKIKAMVIGLVCQKLFIERMTARKLEEYKQVHHSTHYFEEDEDTKQTMPLVWIVLDEAHEFLPNKGHTMATDALITILREGRQPGISLILASQQPGKIHTDVMTQADTVIAHRITAKLDTEALGTLMQSYMRQGLDQELDQLPRSKGAAIIFDDTNEKMYPMQVRPRTTWHGGDSPVALKLQDKRFQIL